jgi:ABC-type lipoprotein release transport system permease subunit
MALVPLFYNRRSLWSRKVTTAASLVGIALVVFVFCAVLMLARGIETTLATTGHAQNAIALRKGAQAEIQSLIDRDLSKVLSLAPEVETDDKGPLASAELVVLIVLDRASGEGGSNILVRGLGPRALDLHAQAKIVEGRMFERGQGEIIIGRKLAHRFRGTALGDSVKLGRRTWRVVGILDSDGSAFDSEIWGDTEEMMSSFQRDSFSSVIVRLKSGALPAYQQRIAADPRMNLDIKGEVAYYAEQSNQLATFIRILGTVVAVIFSLGAMAGATITMYAQVAARVREIGTLRALGFARGAILLGFVAESLLLALSGGALGVALASAMQLASFSTVNWMSFSEVVFRFDLSAGIVIRSLVFATVIGVLGGLPPAIRAARMKVVDIIRA